MVLFYKNTISYLRFKKIPCLEGNDFEEIKLFLKNGLTRKMKGRNSDLFIDNLSTLVVLLQK